MDKHTLICSVKKVNFELKAHAQISEEVVVDLEPYDIYGPYKKNLKNLQKM